MTTYRLRGETYELAIPITDEERRRLNWVSQKYPDVTVRKEAAQLLGEVMHGEDMRQKAEHDLLHNEREMFGGCVRMTLRVLRENGKFTRRIDELCRQQIKLGSGGHTRFEDEILYVALRVWGNYEQSFASKRLSSGVIETFIAQGKQENW